MNPTGAAMSKLLDRIQITEMYLPTVTTATSEEYESEKAKFIYQFRMGSWQIDYNLQNEWHRKYPNGYSDWLKLHSAVNPQDITAMVNKLNEVIRLLMKIQNKVI